MSDKLLPGNNDETTRIPGDEVIRQLRPVFSMVSGIGKQNLTPVYEMHGKGSLIYRLEMNHKQMEWNPQDGLNDCSAGFGLEGGNEDMSGRQLFRNGGTAGGSFHTGWKPESA